MHIHHCSVHSVILVSTLPMVLVVLLAMQVLIILQSHSPFFIIILMPLIIKRVGHTRNRRAK